MGLLVVSSMVLTGCGSPSSNPTEQTEVNEPASEETAVVDAGKNQEAGTGETVTIGCWSDDEKKRLEAAFEGIEEETGIKAEFMSYPSDSDFWDNIPAQIAAGTAPDLISCTNEHYLQYIDQGLFESLNPYIESGVISADGIDEVAMGAWKFDDNVYGIPYALNPGVFIINNNMWNEFGYGDNYPTTWDEVLDICKQVKEEHDMPALCLNIQEYHLTNYALSFGGGWDYGKTIDSDANAQALQFLIDAYKAGYVITPNELGLSWDGAVMIQESALFSTGGAWYQSSFATEAPDIELKYLQLPIGNNSAGGGTLHTAALVALKNSSHPDAVAAAIKYAFADEDLFNATVDITEVIPAKSEYFERYRESIPALANLVDYLDVSTPFAYPTESKKFADRLIEYMQQALLTDDSALTGKEIVAKLAEEFASK